MRSIINLIFSKLSWVVKIKYLKRGKVFSQEMFKLSSFKTEWFEEEEEELFGLLDSVRLRIGMIFKRFSVCCGSMKLFIIFLLVFRK